MCTIVAALTDCQTPPTCPRGVGTRGRGANTWLNVADSITAFPLLVRHAVWYCTWCSTRVWYCTWCSTRIVLHMVFDEGMVLHMVFDEGMPVGKNRKEVTSGRVGGRCTAP
eukprot:6620812-Pyramimonas_sp.AAC.1